MSILLAICALLQTDTPEQTFNAIEAKLKKATTLSLRAHISHTVTINTRTATAESTCIIKFKSPSCINILATGHLKAAGEVPEKKHVHIISNGAKSTVDLGKGPRDLPTRLLAGFPMILSRSGMFIGLGVLLIETFDSNGNPIPFDLDLSSQFNVTGITKGEKDGKLETMKYTMTRRVLETIEKVNVKIWYEEGSLLIRKRVIDQSEKDIVNIVTETYEDVELDPIKFEEQFKLPK